MKQPVPCCLPLNTGNLTADEIMRFAALFRVLGKPARLQLLNLIAAQPRQEVRACELVETLGLSQPTVSHHLKVMYEAGLLSKERRGTWIYYRIVPQSLDALRSALAYNQRSNPLDQSLDQPLDQSLDQCSDQAGDQVRDQARDQAIAIGMNPDIPCNQFSRSVSKPPLECPS